MNISLFTFCLQMRKQTLLLHDFSQGLEELTGSQSVTYVGLIFFKHLHLWGFLFYSLLWIELQGLAHVSTLTAELHFKPRWMFFWKTKCWLAEAREGIEHKWQVFISHPLKQPDFFKSLVQISMIKGKQLVVKGRKMKWCRDDSLYNKTE